MRRATPAGIVVALLVTTLLAACSSKHHTPVARVADRTRGGTLRVGLTRPSSLDPAKARTVEELFLADQLFDSLTNADPVRQTAMPSVAASWSSSGDLRQWDFTLRPGATFGNGRPITSDDVRYTLERIAKKGSGSAGADELSLVTGYKAFAVTGTAPTLAGLSTPAPNVLRINLDSPWSSLPDALANPVFGIVPKEAVEAASPPFGDQPVGSGPFRVQSRDATHLVLDKAPGSAALLDTVDVTYFDTVADSYQAFKRNAVDWSRVPTEQVVQAATTYGRDGYEPYVGEVLFGFNMTSPTFADARFREAIVHAVDRKAIVKDVYQDAALPLDGIVGKGVPGHVDNVCADKCTFDQALAKQLIAAAYPPGKTVPTVPIDFDDDPAVQKVAQAIKDDLAAVGITATLRPHPAAQYADFTAGADKQLFRLGWVAPFAAPDAFLGPLFISGSPANVTGFSAKPVDAAIAAGRAESDQAARLSHYHDAEVAVTQASVVIPIAQLELHTVSAPGVNSVEMTPIGTFDASEVWLDATKAKTAKK